MILYINGDSHTAAAEAVNPYAFAEDDPTLPHLGRVPHPANLAVSWGRLLSLTLKAGFHCSAESASSNARILRTTRDWLHQQVTYDDMLLIIQWSTWEREEWLYDGVYYQVGASGTDGVPAEAAERYRHYIVSVDWKQKTQEAHDEIWKFHQELSDQGVRHIFGGATQTAVVPPSSSLLPARAFSSTPATPAAATRPASSRFSPRPRVSNISTTSSSPTCTLTILAAPPKSPPKYPSKTFGTTASPTPTRTATATPPGP